MNAHTPGPWEAVDRFTVRGPYVMGDSQRPGLLVATLPPSCAPGDSHLVAAAPDLLFQLLAASNYIDALGGDSRSYRAFIAKAEGRA